MGSNPTLKTAAASLVALALALTAFTTPAASQAPSEDLNPETTTKPDCYQLYLGEHEAGPVTVDASDSCVEVQVDEPASQQSIPPCAGIGGDIVNAGPATVGITDYCQIYVDVDKDWRPSPNQPNCIQVYIERSVGPVTVTYTCSSGGDVTFDEDWSVEDEVPTSSSPDCYDVYYQEEVGPATVTVTSTCSASVSVDGEQSPTGASTADQECYHVYYEKSAGPVTLVMTSSCSGHVEFDRTWRP